MSRDLSPLSLLLLPLEESFDELLLVMMETPVEPNHSESELLHLEIERPLHGCVFTFVVMSVLVFSITIEERICQEGG